MDLPTTAFPDVPARPRLSKPVKPDALAVTERLQLDFVFRQGDSVSGYYVRSEKLPSTAVVKSTRTISGGQGK